MPRYHRIAQTVEARRWGGTRIDAERLCVWASEKYAAVTTSYSQDNVGGLPLHIEIDIGRGHPFYVFPGDYLLWVDAGGFAAMTTDEFNAQYTLIDADQMVG